MSNTNKGSWIIGGTTLTGIGVGFGIASLNSRK